MHGVDVRIGLTVPQGIVEQFTADEASGLGWHSPEYGRLERTTTVRVTQSGTAPLWMVTVFDLDPANPVADVDWVAVWAEASATAHATAIRITRATSVDHVLFAEPAARHEGQHPESAETAERAVQPAIAASAAAKRGLWRVGEIETNARMLFCRTTGADRLDRIAMVDGSMVRTTGRAGIHVRLPLVAPSFFWTIAHAPRTQDQYSCAASPVS
jgi:hypothetical protein